MRRFNTTFARPLPQNILNVVEANQAAFLAEANVDGADQPLPALPVFNEFNRARPTNPTFPALTVYRRRTRNITQENDQIISGVAEFAIEIAIEAETPDAAMSALEIYVEAVDSIIRTVGVENPMMLLAGIDESVAGLITLDITEHVYGNNEPEGTRHVRAAALTLTASLMEV